ncbi:FAD/NAD(P)-binding oxidoreductase, partial [Pseudomonas aeruginosa]
AALGEERLEAVRLREGGRVREIACERLACGFGLVPNVQLGQALGYRLDGQALAVDEWQAGSLPDHYAAGECTGFGGSELALVEGAIAGHAAVDERDAARRLWPRRRSYRADSYVLAALGEERLEAVRLREGGRVREIACERLACGFG